eukprot:tig00021281_g19924.t1
MSAYTYDPAQDSSYSNQYYDPNLQLQTTSTFADLGYDSSSQTYESAGHTLYADNGTSMATLSDLTRILNESINNVGQIQTDVKVTDWQNVDETADVDALPDGLFAAAVGEAELLEADADELLQAEAVYASEM